MSERLIKMRIAIQNKAADADAEWLRGACHQMLEMALVLDRRDPDERYAAMIYGPCYPCGESRWFQVASGSKDYCVGFLGAYTNRDGGPADDHKVVAVGSFIVWPESRWGDSIEVAE